MGVCDGGWTCEKLDRRRGFRAGVWDEFSSGTESENVSPAFSATTMYIAYDV